MGRDAMGWIRGEDRREESRAEFPWQSEAPVSCAEIIYQKWDRERGWVLDALRALTLHHARD